MTLSDYLRQELGVRWALCRDTPRARCMGYRPVTKRRFAEVTRRWAGLFPELAADEVMSGFLDPAVERELKERAADKIRAALTEAARELYGKGA